jgi:hypothetical protein
MFLLCEPICGRTRQARSQGVNQAVLFGEAEVRLLLSAVNEFHDELAASTPRLFCFPDIGVLICSCVVGQTTSTRRDRFLNRIGAWW